MARIRSLAKELRHLEKQKQVTTTSSPPPLHADPEERTSTATSVTTNTAAATGASSSLGEGNKKLSSVSITSVKSDSTRHAASPPVQTNETVLSSSSSSLSTPALREVDAAHVASAQPTDKRSDAEAERITRSSSSDDAGDAKNSRSGGHHRLNKNKADLFTLGGSRFDILMSGSYGDGAACRKSEVRRATKICSCGKDFRHRSLEDLTTSAEGAQGGTQQATGNADSNNINTLKEAPPAPPLGTPCGITTRPPFKRLLPQPFSHILVCDFEATCAGGSVHYPHEIIEFPVVVLDTATLNIVAEFHRYVKPVRNPKLTPFCTELTGITQEVVDKADTLPVVVEQFQQWLEQEIYPLCAKWAAHYGPEKLSHNLKSEQKRFVLDDRTEQAKANAVYEAMICIATDGPWDMRRFMHECSVMRDGIAFPPLCYRYINVRHSYSDQFKCRQIKLTHMLKKLSMSFEGRRHSGIDDTRNITRVLAELMARGYRVHHVSTIKYSHRGDAFLESNQAAQELLSEYGEDDQTHTSRHSNKHKNATKR